MLRKLLIILCIGFATPVWSGAYEDMLAAAAAGHVDTVKDLVQRGLDVNTTDPQGNNLLAIAARGGNLGLVNFLLAHRASEHHRNQFGEAALHLATFAGHDDIVERLLRAGADVNSEGWSPLHYAAFNGNKILAKRLLAAGALIDARAPNRWTALMIAAKGGHVDIVQLLAQAGANQLLTDADGKTARIIALENGSDLIDDYLTPAQELRQ